jgi:chromosomal replication initiation ATPase DnaA
MEIKITESRPASPLNIELMFNTIEAITGTTKKEILSSSRKRKCVVARTYCAILLRDMFKMTFVEAGQMLNRNHASIIHALKAHKTDMKHDPTYSWRFKEVVSIMGLNHYTPLPYEDITRKISENMRRTSVIKISDK